MGLTTITRSSKSLWFDQETIIGHRLTVQLRRADILRLSIIASDHLIVEGSRPLRVTVLIIASKEEMMIVLIKVWFRQIILI